MRSRAQHYATVAFGSLEGIDTASVEASKYGTICREYPSLVMLNGLHLTMCYYLSKRSGSNCAYTKYLEAMAKALELDESWEKKLRDCPSHEYRLLTKRALDASVWFKRYVEAILKTDERADVEA